MKEFNIFQCPFIPDIFRFSGFFKKKKDGENNLG